jgi:hypothetical protein
MGGGYTGWAVPKRVVTFHILSTLPDTHPVVVKRGCDIINVTTVSDYCARASQ